MKNKSPVYLKKFLKISLFSALSVVLSYIQIFQMPQGGSISLKDLPIVVISILEGPYAGFITGVIFGILHSLKDSYVVHPLQFLLDYPLAYGFLGLAGIISLKNKKGFIKIVLIDLSVIFGESLRLLIHIISGIVFFKSYVTAGKGLFSYVIFYNLSFIIPETVILLMLTPLIIQSMGFMPGEKN
jgi:thiamine transporter